jgi:rhodanese-related sulfurtransferase
MRKSIDDLLAEARASLRRIDPVRAYEAMQNGTVLVDTRSDDQRRRSGAIPGAINIPLSVLEWRVDPVSPHRDPAVGDTGEPIILICAEGYSSSLAARRLQDIGFSQATDVIGGFAAWKDARLPVVAADG